MSESSAHGSQSVVGLTFGSLSFAMTLQSFSAPRGELKLALVGLAPDFKKKKTKEMDRRNTYGHLSAPTGASSMLRVPLLLAKQQFCSEWRRQTEASGQESRDSSSNRRLLPPQVIDSPPPVQTTAIAAAFATGVT